MKQTYILTLVVMSTVVAGCTTSNTNSADTNTNTTINRTVDVPTEDTNDSSEADAAVTAYFYQIVGPFINGSGNNSVRVGKTNDGMTVDSYQPDDSGNVLEWTQGANHSYAYGDPVFSRLASGSWIMTARSSSADPRGANRLLYAESSCPLVDDDTVVAISPSSASGCKPVNALTQGKTSQVFTDDEGRNLVFSMISGDIYLTYLSDASQSATALDSVCVLQQPVASMDELELGSATSIFTDQQIGNLLLSDTAIARRSDIDGTWALFVKGIPNDLGCTDRSLCELCARSIYRTTSTDLIHWTDLELVVEQASVPEATTTPDGNVWLYWQDFSNTCDAGDEKLSAQSPISGAYEQAGSNELSDKVTVSFPDEEFEGDDKLHYATNGNPVTLPDAQAQAALEACFN
ncbi:MAG: hypothetical protein HY565_04215 [Candidatus Kerfeldbacteria bacterium]|nr:hypothetical protein [Candidatus Kerfeldbacteria bacterium]